MRIPPALLALALLAMSACLHLWFPIGVLRFSGQMLLGGALTLAGCILLFLSVTQFRAWKTTVNPMAPENSTALVVTGLYRITRNPMYLGMAFVLGGFGLIAGSMGAFFGVVLFVVWMTFVQIPSEEQALRTIFGASYESYMKKVRRWI